MDSFLDEITENTLCFKSVVTVLRPAAHGSPRRIYDLPEIGARLSLADVYEGLDVDPR